MNWNNPDMVGYVFIRPVDGTTVVVEWVEPPIVRVRVSLGSLMNMHPGRRALLNIGVLEAFWTVFRSSDAAQDRSRHETLPYPVCSAPRCVGRVNGGPANRVFTVRGENDNPGLCTECYVRQRGW